MLVLGIMSGTSLDGVDYALCRCAPGSIDLLEHWTASFPKQLRQRLLAAASGQSNSYETARLHHDLGRFYARAALRHSAAAKAQLIGLHGQTIFHAPDRRTPATLQIGEPSYLAEVLERTVVFNFRTADLAAGGQGAPLATLFHLHALSSPEEITIVQNIGGIGNVTYLDRTRAEPKVIAFDTGPGVMLIDMAVRRITDGRLHFDRNGVMAAKGRVDQALLEKWLRHPFLRMKPPKSTGRELFGETFFRDHVPVRYLLRRPNDLVATLTSFTAESIAQSYRRHLPKPPARVIVTGGGGANPVLLKRLTNSVHQWANLTQVVTARDLGWPLQVVEPAAFALLAYNRTAGVAGNLPETTGARRACLLGQICDPPGGTRVR